MGQNIYTACLLYLIIISKVKLISKDTNQTWLEVSEHKIDPEITLFIGQHICTSCLTHLITNSKVNLNIAAKTQTRIGSIRMEKF